MKWKDTIPGMTVYHAVFTHWGKGMVQDRRLRDNLGLPTAWKVRVLWDGQGPQGPVWMRCSELRRTPK